MEPRRYVPSSAISRWSKVISMHKTALSAVAAAFLAACASAPAYQRSSVAVPPAYAPAKAAQSAHFRIAVTTTPFWREIGDTTLTKLVEQALRGNTSVRIAEARLDATRATRRLAAFD